MKRSRIDEDRFSALVAKKNFEKMRGILGESDLISPVRTQASA